MKSHGVLLSFSLIASGCGRGRVPDPMPPDPVAEREITPVPQAERANGPSTEERNEAPDAPLEAGIASQKREESEEEVFGVITEGLRRFRKIDFQRVGKIVIAKSGGVPVALEEKSGAWVAASAYGYPADGSRVQSILDSLRDLQVEVVAERATSHEILHVDERQGVFITLSAGEGAEQGCIIVGKRAPSASGEAAFIRFPDDFITYRAESGIRSRAGLWGHGPRNSYFLEKNLLKIPKECEVHRVTLIRPGEKDLSVERHPGRDSQAESYVLIVGEEQRVVPPSQVWLARGLLERFRELTIEDAAEPKSLEEHGVAAPLLKAVISFRKRDDPDATAEVITLRLGAAPGKQRQENYFIIREGEGYEGRIYTVPSYRFNEINKRPEDFKENPKAPQASKELQNRKK